MIHELRIYTTRPGKVPELLRANEEIGRKVRGDNYGVLEGYWFTDIGPLNQVFHLWRWDSYEDRERLRGELYKVDGWTKEYIPAIRPHLVRQDVRLLQNTRALAAPAKGGNFYEFRNYRLKPGTAGQWMERFLGVMPVREKYSKIVGAWITQNPDPNEVCHLWAYQDTNERKATRDGVAGETAWQEFAAFGGDLIEEMHSTMLWPASFSPLQ